VKPFRIYNTLTRSVEEFRPLNPGTVTMYSCGPTVYLPQHLGNLRAYMCWDFLKRALEYNGWRVRHVINVTDVGHMTSNEDEGEDKIELTARAEGKSPLEIANRYFEKFKVDLAALNYQPPEVWCRATEHINDMIALIARIIDAGYAYVTPSGVYFDVLEWRGNSPVGRLSRQPLEEQHAEQRLEHSPDKKSPHDFALWVLNQPQHIMQWDSPWGRGYPGWHIECSAMSMRYLGETIDIHTGGTDHIPVHHENEIAQSESATGKPFVRFFVHNAWLLDKEGAKISKSSGKFPLLDDLVAEGVNPLAFRLLCFGAKIRSEMAFSVDAVRAAERNLYYLWEFAAKADAGAPDADWTASFRERFQNALNDDVNTPEALAVALDLVHKAYRDNDLRIWSTLRDFDRVLGLRIEEQYRFVREAKPPADIQTLIDQRAEARGSKDFARSDEIRKRLAALGWTVKDNRDGSSEYKPRFTAGTSP
jgi:cysteinyl-tRNA synthetase